MSAFRKDFVTECTYFIIKEEDVFGMYMEIWEKGNNIIKKLTVNLYKVKKYLIAKKTFECCYRIGIQVPVILIDSVYKKDENYYPKVFLKEYHSF